MNVDPRAELSAEQIRGLLDAALHLADVCASTVADVIGTGFEVQTKSDRSLVTSADLEAEKAFRTAVAARFPHHGVLGEEQGLDNPQADFRWIVDPIDGTAEFARGMPIYGTIIGLMYRGRALVGVIDHPAMGLRVSGAHGQGLRRNGEPVTLDAVDPMGMREWPRIGMPSRAGFIRRSDSGAIFDAITHAYPEVRCFHTCYSHSSALIGALDAAIEWDTSPWDLGAIEMLATEAGGWYRLIREFEHPSAGTLYSVVFGRQAVAEPLAELIEGLL